MKSLILGFFLCASFQAFASPFSNFTGSFAVASTPQVVMIGMSYCDWLGFRELVGLTIAKDGNLEVADLSANLNGSIMHSYITFKEYTSTSEFGVSTAKISGDVNKVTYLMLDQSTNFADATSWSISKKNGNSYHLQMESRETSRATANKEAACIYDVELTKK